MDRRILELALEALEGKRADLQKQIAELNAELKGSSQSMVARKTQSERMREYWERKRLESAKLSTAAQPVAASKNRRPRSDAERKAQSERMKAYWAKRKKGKARSSKTKA